MIYSINGELIHKEPSLAVIECSGVGYALRTTDNTLASIKLGEKVKLFTSMQVREDSVELFGFSDISELNCFKMLITVSGVGPKAAISILTVVSPQTLALCVVTGDSKTLTKAQGVGSKIAQRIVLELKDKFSKNMDIAGYTADIPTVTANNNASEAVAALVVLGFSQSEAAKSIASLTPDTSVEDMIKHGLKQLAGK